MAVEKYSIELEAEIAKFEANIEQARKKIAELEKQSKETSKQVQKDFENTKVEVGKNQESSFLEKLGQSAQKFSKALLIGGGAIAATKGLQVVLRKLVSDNDQAADSFRKLFNATNATVGPLAGLIKLIPGVQGPLRSLLSIIQSATVNLSIFSSSVRTLAKESPGFKSFADNFVHGVDVIERNTLKFIKGPVSTLGVALASIGDKFKKFGEDSSGSGGISTFYNALAAGFSSAGSALTKVSSKFTEVGNVVGQSLSKAGTSVRNFVGGIPLIGSGLLKVGDIIEDTFARIAAGAAGVLPGKFGKLSVSAEKASVIMEGLGTATAGVVPGAEALVFTSGVLGVALTALNGVIALVGVGMQNLGKSMIDVSKSWGYEAATIDLNFTRLDAVLKNLNATFDRNLGSADAWLESINEMSRATGINNNLFKDMALKMVEVGASSDLVQDQMIELTKRAVLVGVTLKDVGRAFIAFRGAFSGDTTSLSSFTGIDISKTAIEKFRREADIAGKSVRDLSDDQVRFAIIMKGTDSYMDAANAAMSTYFGLIERTNGALLNLRQSLGEGALPGLIATQRAILGIVTALDKLPAPIKASVGFMTDFGGTLLYIAGFLLKLAGTFALLTTAVKATGAILGISLGSQLGTVGKFLATTAASVSGLGAAAAGAAAPVSTLGGVVKALFSITAGSIEKLFTSLVKLPITLARAIFSFKALAVAGIVLAGAFKALLALLIKFAIPILAINFAIDVLVKIWEILTKRISLSTGTMKLFGDMATWIGNRFTWLKDLTFNYGKVVSGVAKLILSAFAALIYSVSLVYSKIIGLFSYLPKAAAAFHRFFGRESIAKDFDKLSEEMDKGAEALDNFAASAAGAAYSDFTSGIDDLKNAFTKTGEEAKKAGDKVKRSFQLPKEVLDDIKKLEEELRRGRQDIDAELRLQQQLFSTIDEGRRREIEILDEVNKKRNDLTRSIDDAINKLIEQSDKLKISKDDLKSYNGALEATRTRLKGIAEGTISQFRKVTELKKEFVFTQAQQREISESFAKAINKDNFLEAYEDLAKQDETQILNLIKTRKRLLVGDKTALEAFPQGVKVLDAELQKLQNRLEQTKADILNESLRVGTQLLEQELKVAEDLKVVLGQDYDLTNARTDILRKRMEELIKARNELLKKSPTANQEGDINFGGLQRINDDIYNLQTTIRQLSFQHLRDEFNKIGRTYEQQMLISARMKEVFKTDFDSTEANISLVTNRIQELINFVSTQKIDSKLTDQINREIERLGVTLKELKESLKLKQVATEIFDSIADAVTTSVDAVVRGTKTIKEAFREMGQSILLSISEALNRRFIIDPLKEFVGNAIDEIQKKFKDIKIPLPSVAADILDSDAIKKLLSGKAPAEVLEVIKKQNLLTETANLAAETANLTAETANITFFQTAITHFESVVAQIQALLAKFGFGSGVVPTGRTGVPVTGDTTSTGNIYDIGNIIEEDITGMFSDLGTSFSEGLDSLSAIGSDGFGGMFDDLSGYLEEGFQGITELFSGGDSGAGFFAEAFSWISSLFGGFFAKGGKIPGRPSSKDNTIAAVSSGEYITKSPAVRYYGSELFEALNNMDIPRNTMSRLLTTLNDPDVALNMGRSLNNLVYSLNSLPQFAEGGLVSTPLINTPLIPLAPLSSPSQAVRDIDLEPKFLVQVIQNGPTIDPKSFGLNEKDVTRVVVTQLKKGGPIQNASREDTKLSRNT